MKFKKYDLQRLNRVGDLNDKELKEFLIALSNHKQKTAREYLGYTCPNPFYQWKKWTYYHFPLIYLIADKHIDLSQADDIEMEVYITSIRNFVNKIKNEN